MAERFINNIEIGQDRDEQEKKKLILYKKQASLKELQPVFIYFSSFASSTTNSGIPDVGPFGVNFRVDVNNSDLLNNTNFPDYFYEVSLLNAEVVRYNLGIPGTQLIVPQESIYLKLENLTNEPFDFAISPPAEKQTNRVIYLTQKTFPSQLVLRLGYCDATQSSSSFGSYYDINEDLPNPNIQAPFNLHYGQSISSITIRLQVRQLHMF